MNTEEKLRYQVKAKAVFFFLDRYNMMEKKIKSIFASEFKKLDLRDINILHFYYGMRAYRVTINYDDETYDLSTNKYEDKNEFKLFTLNDLIKINGSKRLVDKLLFDVDSIQISRQSYPFNDCVKKLINMRNILAHEVISPKFKNREVIELLSDERIIEKIDIVEEGEVGKMDEQTKQIFSNIAYIDKIYKQLEKMDS